MKRFFAAWLPADERYAVLWIAFAGAAIGWLTRFVSETAISQLQAQAGLPDAPGASLAIVSLTSFAIAMLLTWALVRFARAPRALAFYLIGSQLASAAASLLGFPLEWWSQSFAPEAILAAGTVYGLVSALAVTLGALAGAWIVDAVTLTKIRATGDEEVDSQQPEPKLRPATGRWGFIGIDARPFRDDALIAWALIGYAVVIEAAGVLQSGIASVATSAMSSGADVNTTYAFVNGFVPALGLFAVGVAAYVSTRRTGVRSVWVESAAGALVFGLSSLMYIPQVAAYGTAAILAQLTWVPFAFVAIAIAIGGSALALRRDAARLSARKK